SYTETTAGSLYVYDHQLFVTLSRYRYSKIRTNINVRNINYQSVGLDYNGLKNRHLVFDPKAAQRSDGFSPPPGGKSIDRFLAIDYQLLQQAPTATTEGAGTPDIPAPTAEALATREAEIRALKDRVNKNASEMETLRKDLKSLQDQVGSQTTGQDNQKR